MKRGSHVIFSSHNFSNIDNKKEQEENVEDGYGEEAEEMEKIHHRRDERALRSLESAPLSTVEMMLLVQTRTSVRMSKIKKEKVEQLHLICTTHSSDHILYRISYYRTSH